ncbi:hypothetical protein ARNL5_04039 [Anaerolineae bacterium]|nr:hypothetical protein ARNL5_04039 [Anaerolineae bacterium]
MDKTKKNRHGLLTMNAYAKRRGVSHTAVAKAVKAGRISRTAEGLINPEAADRQWADNTDPSKPLNSVTGNPRHRRNMDSPSMSSSNPETASTAQAGGLPPYSQSRAIREAYEARLRKLEYEVRIGKLISADEVKVVAFNIARITRDKLMGIPDRLAPILAGISDSHEAHRLLSAEIRLVCEDLSKPDSYSNIKKASDQ